MASGSQSPRNKNSEVERKRSRRSSSSNSSHSSPSRRSGQARKRSASGERGGRSKPPYPRREYEPTPQSAKLFVTNIDSKFTREELDEDLRALFAPFGKIKEVVVKTKQGSSNSYCFIEYETVEDAAKAQQELKGKDFKGKELKVQFGRGERKAQDRRSDQCYICHKQGHFAKDCKYNRYTGSAYNDDRRGRDERDRRDYRGRDYERDRDYRGRDRDYRQRKHRRRDSYSRSSSSGRDRRRSSRYDRDRQRGREDYRRRDRDYSPDKRGGYPSGRY